MIPAKFDYVRPGSLDEAVTALADGGDDAKVIAGGQSLLPLLRLRLAYPELLVDVGGLAELRGVTDAGDALSIGARTTLYQLVHDPLVAEHCGLLAQASAAVADPAVRHRSTLGGALVHADPAGDLPAVALALDATLIARGPDGERAIPAADFFVDYLTSSLEPDEILTAIRVPKLGSGWGYRYEKFHRTAQSWATVGVAALVRRSNGSVAEARIGLTNMGPIPVRATAAEGAAAGAQAEPGRAAGRGWPRGRGHEPAGRPAWRTRLPPAPGQGADRTGDGHGGGSLTQGGRTGPGTGPPSPFLGRTSLVSRPGVPASGGPGRGAARYGPTRGRRRSPRLRSSPRCTGTGSWPRSAPVRSRSSRTPAMPRQRTRKALAASSHPVPRAVVVDLDDLPRWRHLKKHRPDIEGSCPCCSQLAWPRAGREEVRDANTTVELR